MSAKVFSYIKKEQRKHILKNEKSNDYNMKKEYDKISKKIKLKLNSSLKNIKVIRDIKSSIEIDDELHNLWNTLSVTNEFKKKFKEKLIYFSKEYKEIIIEAEKIKMNKIFNIITKITNESLLREKDIIILKSFQQMNLSYYSDFKNYNEALKNLKNLRNHTLHFYQLIIDLRNLISFDIIQGKFDLDKNEFFKNIHPENYFKLNNEMKFIHESSLGTISKLKGIFEFFIYGFSK